MSDDTNNFWYKHDPAIGMPDASREVLEAEDETTKARRMLAVMSGFIHSECSIMAGKLHEVPYVVMRLDLFEDLMFLAQEMSRLIDDYGADVRLGLTATQEQES